MSALTLAAPGTAAAQCELPKGVYVGMAQLEYALNLEVGLLMDHTERQLEDPDPLRYAKQRRESARYVFVAGRDFARTIVASGPPQC